MGAEISVVILCYKAENQVYDFVNKTISLLESENLSWELILVGNYIEGSSDKTPEIVKKIAEEKEHVKAVTLPKEGMMGWDARSGMNVAEGKFICLIDGDKQMPYQDIVRAYKKIKEEALDFVQTYRVIRYDGLIRKINSASYNFLFKILFPGTRLRDINSKPKVLTQEAYRRMLLTSNDWFIDAEMVIRAIALKLKVGEVPTNFYKCSYRKSFVNFYTVFEFIKNLFIVRITGFFKR